MILSCNNIYKSFGENSIIKNGSFIVEDREKVAIVGINGAGKTTLLKIIMGEEPADSGSVIVAKDKSVGFLSQHQHFEKNRTIYEEVLEVKKDLIDQENRIREIEASMANAAGDELEQLMKEYSRLNHDFELKNGYAYKSEVVGVLKGLGFKEEDFSKHVDDLSGGQKTRVSLAKLLSRKPDVILLDEPTNHLDMASIEWLEGFLLNYDGAVIIVAHDRYFLDKICTKIVDIDNAELRVYTGNYSAFAKKKEIIRAAKIKEYQNNLREIKHQEEVIEKLKSFNREKSIKRAESRQKMLDKMEVVEKPVDVNDSMRLEFTPEVESGKDVLEVKGLAKSFDNIELFKDLDFEIKRGERVALIGNNGTGKTTILKIINGLYEADAGTVKLGAKVAIGYYDQEHQVVDFEKTAYDEITDDYPNLTQTKVRNVLAAFLFTDDDVFKQIKSLSGGERGRIALAKLMLSNANFLILDEPTNHLDMVSKEILEDVLKNYTGTLLFVSHDRYFINQTATRILDLSGKKLINYIGNYDYYLEKKEEQERIHLSEDEGALTFAAKTTTKEDYAANKARQAQIRKDRNKLKKTEEEIAELEGKIAALDEELADPANATNSYKLNEIHEKKSELNERLEELYDIWEEIADIVE